MCRVPADRPPTWKLTSCRTGPTGRPSALFEHQEICRTQDLEALVRQANAMAGCRSLDDVVNAFRAMRTLG
jgi:hypothetical protein